LPICPSCLVLFCLIYKTTPASPLAFVTACTTRYQAQGMPKVSIVFWFVGLVHSVVCDASGQCANTTESLIRLGHLDEPDNVVVKLVHSPHLLVLHMKDKVQLHSER
jgi:hypothetical protein